MSLFPYEAWFTFCNHHPRIRQFVIFLANICPIISFVSYGILIGWIGILLSFMLLYFIIIPAGAFFTTTIIRNYLNAPRPFEVLGFQPLKPHKPGRSLPSRHSTSALIIALVWLTVQPLVGYLLLFNTLIIGLTRCLMGVHYPRDVLIGYGVALLWWILPMIL